MEAPRCFKPGYDVARSAPSLYLVSNPVCESSKEPNLKVRPQDGPQDPSLQKLPSAAHFFPTAPQPRGLTPRCQQGTLDVGPWDSVVLVTAFGWWRHRHFCTAGAYGRQPICRAKGLVWRHLQSSTFVLRLFIWGGMGRDYQGLKPPTLNTKPQVWGAREETTIHAAISEKVSLGRNKGACHRASR